MKNGLEGYRFQAMSRLNIDPLLNETLASFFTPALVSRQEVSLHNEDHH